MVNIVTRKDLAACFIASLVSGPVFVWLGNIFTPPPQVMSDPLWVIVLVLPFLVQIYTYPVTIVGMLFIGLPVHAIIKRLFGGSYLLLGLSGGPVVWLIMLFFNIGESSDGFLWLFVACGAAVSACYALLCKQFATLHGAPNHKGTR